ncbi:GumC family protein [Sphingorhabdus arenilitoris]|uniref:non-specific protein-tyrosine kinase n=1 Tax=Sphingorhabdus arenilitoris TaxID=1490041 RepID=A0ABV8RGG9_9SPHN
MKENTITDMTQKSPQIPYDSQPYASLDETPLIFQYWQALLRHKFAMLAIITLCLAAGVIVTLLTTPYYTAGSRIEINREQDKVTNVEGLQSEGVGQNLEFYQTQYSLLEARSLADRVVRSERLASDTKFFDVFGIDVEQSGIITGGQKTTGASPSAAERNRRTKLAADILLQNINIAPIRGSSLVDIKFNSPSPGLSARIANRWVDEFIASNMDRRFGSSAEARQFLEKQLAILKQRLEDSERELASYADEKQIVTLTSEQNAEGRTISQKTLSSSSLEALNEALANAVAERIAAQNEARQRAGDKNALSNSALNNLREERAAAQAEYDKLMVQFEPGYPAARAIASKISSLTRSIAAEESRSRTGTNARYNEALGREQQLRAEVNKLKAEFGGERRDAIQFGIFQREVDTNRQLYDGLLQRYKEIGVAGVGSNNISIVDRAEPPTKPSSPVLLLNIALSLLAGLGVAALYVFLREQMDQTIRDPADVRTRLGVSPLGAIPAFEKGDVIEMLQDKKSPAWEAYLSISTSLSFLTEHGVPRSFLLSSTRPNEGKSTSSIALAAVLASSGKRILLIDGDMRNPSLHQFEGMINKAGLSNYLTGNDDINTLISKSETHGFDIMTSGPIPPNSAELLAGKRMTEFVERLRQVYDVVIVDGPPVLGLADIPLLAGSVEGVVYTIEAGGAKLRTIQSSMARIQESGAPIFGAIVTKVSQQGSGYGYGYAYEYSYGKDAKSNSDL